MKTDRTPRHPTRDQSYQFELFELIGLLKVCKQFAAEQCEATVSQSTVPSPPLTRAQSQSGGWQCAAVDDAGGQF